MTITNEETVSATEFYDQIYSGFTDFTVHDLSDYHQDVEREIIEKKIKERDGSGRF